MAQPTQQFPPWLSYSPIIFTNAAGAPVSTTSTIVYLPLTYYGPSIPLDSLWTYGGLTSPASTATTPAAPASSPAFSPTVTPSHALTTSASAIPSTSIPSASSLPSVSAIPPTSIPSSTSSLPSSSAIPSTSMSSSSSSHPPSTLPSLSSMPSSPLHVTSAASTVSATPTQLTPNALSVAHRNAIVAIILGAIFASVLFILIVLLCLRWRVNRNRHRRAADHSFETPIWTDLVDTRPLIPPPRDPDTNRPPGEGSPRHSGSETDPFLTSSRSPENTRSSAGEMQQTDPTARLVTQRNSIPAPEAIAAAIGRADTDSSSTGSGYGTMLDPPTVGSSGRLREHIVPPSDLLKMDDGDAEPAPESYSPLLPPPRLDPDRLGAGRTPQSSQKTSQRSLASHFSDADETATLFTARRVRLSPHSPIAEDQVPSGGPSGLASSLGVGIGALAGLRRLSWLKNMDAPFRRRSRTSSYLTRPLSDYEVESGKALLSEQYTRPSKLGAGSGAGDDRPISGISMRSAASGNTIYHDAPSSPARTPELTPLPRALTPSQTARPGHSRPGSGAGIPAEPWAYDDGHILDSHSPTQTNLDLSFPPGMDVLDIPAPPPASPFASSSSSRGSMGNFPFPPGLAHLQNFKLPSDRTASGVAASDSDAIVIDVLEEEPPSPGHGWRTIARVNPPVVEGDEERRMTFGTADLLHPNEPTTVEQGSLHAGSGSSHHSDALSPTASSGHSYVSPPDSARGMGATSPAVSALGGGRAVNDHGYMTPYPSPPSSPLTAVNKDPITSLTSAGTGESTSSMAQFVGTPWARGLDDD